MKYTTVRAELSKRHPDLNNVIVDVLGGYSNGLRDQLITVIRKLLQEEYCERAKEYLVACY